MNYYNDNDPKKAAWLRVLIEDKIIPAGDVDERSIADVEPVDLIGYTQHHFFAGIGGWSFAMQIAGIGADEEAASCSCPCQPFSQTGKRLGNADPRHLFPQFHRLAGALRFPRVFGEQVASKDGRVWVERVRAEMEDLGYLFEWVDLCAAGVSSPQIRQRIFWVAYANANSERSGKTQRSEGTHKHRHDISGCGCALRLGHSNGTRSQGWLLGRDGGRERSPWASGVGVLGRDGKMRRIEPGILPLADGIPDRVALIGGAGNAIVPLLAAEFIQSCEEARCLEELGI